MTTETLNPPRQREPINGVDVPTLFATIAAVEAQPELCTFRFRATNRWQSGTHSRNTIKTFYGAGGEQEHVREFSVDADHPQVLVGADHAPLPVELLLTALASCLTGGIGNIASARGIELYEVESVIEGDMDIQGILGLPDEVRNGFSKIRIDFTVKGNAPEEKLRALVEQSKARSAVYDVLTNGVPVEIGVDAA